MERQNKTQQLVSVLSREILEGRYGQDERFPTEQEAMARFGVSRVTVRRAYDILERNAVIERRPHFGTAVRTDGTMLTEPITQVGALLPLDFNFSLNFLKVFNEATDSANALTILSPPFRTAHEQEHAAMELFSRGIRNMVVWGMDKELDLSVFHRLRLLGCNMVFFDLLRLSGDADYVGLDCRHAVETLMAQALADGCTKAAFVFMNGPEVASEHDRAVAFRQFCDRHGLPFEEMTIPWEEVRTEQPGTAARAVMERLAGQLDTTAVLCVNNAVSDILMAYCQMEGRSDYHFYTICITAYPCTKQLRYFMQPLAEMAKTCFRLLLHQQQSGASWRAGEYLLKGCPLWR